MLVKGQRYHAASDFDKLLYVAGVPQRYWSTSSKHLDPAVIKYHKYKSEDLTVIKRNTQQDWMQRLLKNPLGSCSICISGYPTDDPALIYAADVVKSHLKRDPNSKVKFFNLDFVNKLTDDSDSVFDLLVLYNITEDNDRLRYARLRDILVRYDDCPKLVVVAGMNPLEFFYEYLRMPVDGVLYFEGRVVRNRRNI